MSKARLVITAVTVEKRPVSEVARTYGAARSRVYALLARYRAEGGGVRVAVATISRYLTRGGLVTPEPKKRPKSSCIRFAAEQPSERWQSDFIHGHLAGGTEAEIVSWLDDHSRLALSVTACPVTTGQVTLATFRATCAAYGVPASTLTDNGNVCTTRFAGGKGGRNGLENELRRLGVTQKNGRPSHPQTQGKAERFQQTLKKWLAARPAAAELAGLQAQLDQFTSYYNKPAAAPIPGPPLHPRHRLRRPAQGRPRRPRRRHPRSRPRRHHQHQRHPHPPPRRQAPPHRRRPSPRRNPRPAARPRPGHPHHRRRHRRTAPPAHPQPRPQLPAHRPSARTHVPNAPPTQTPQTLTWVRGVLDVLQHHTNKNPIIEPTSVEAPARNSPDPTTVRAPAQLRCVSCTQAGTTRLLSPRSIRSHKKMMTSSTSLR